MKKEQLAFNFLFCSLCSKRYAVYAYIWSETT